MNKITSIVFIAFLLFSATIFSQEENKEKAEEDFEYEMKHKSQPWFSNMKDGANYFDIKANYDTYFGNHRFEKSKPRSIGQNWLKSKLFYLDANGIVQSEPSVKNTTTFNSPLNTMSFASTTTLGSWDLIGPVNSETTSYSGKGNHGGYVFLNRIDPTNTSKRFVAFVTGGLWMTSDGGTNWALVDSNMPDDKYWDLDVSISNSQVVYAISDHQVIKSTDGGLNWLSTTLTNSTYAGTAYDIAVSTSSSDIVVARWGNTIYRTTDGGTTWNSVLTGLPNHQIWDSSVHSEMLDWSTTNANVVYSLSTSHNNMVLVHRSDDAGASFSQIATLTLDGSANGQIVGWAKLLLPTSNAASIYIAVGSGDNPYAHLATHLYKINATSGALETIKTNMISGIGNSFNHDPVLNHGDISMDRNNENKIVYGSYGNQRVHISSDNGDNFVLSAASTHSDIRTVDVIGNLMLIGSDGETVESTDNGATLTTLTNSISNHELWGFGSAFKTNLVASGNNHGPVMIKESANGFDWYNGTGADQGNTDVNPLDDRYVYSQGYDNYRYFRTGTHTLINESNLLDLGGIYAYFNSIEFHPNLYYSIITHHAGQYPNGNPNLAIWKNSLIKTEDNGNSVTIIKTFSNQVFREKISMKNPNHMYVVEGLTNNKLWHTSDAGVNWTEITPPSSVTVGQTNISDIAVGDENPNEIWVTYSGVQSACKVLKSNDYGVTWTNLTQASLTDFPMTKIVFQRGSNGGVYVGNKSGIYYKNNTMANWEALGAGLPMCEVRFMFINYNENKLKIGTSRGAFTHDLYEISPPNALISASTGKVQCSAVEMVQFKDYSVVRNDSATWSWSFEGATPATSTQENPEVSYNGVAEGNYDVTLTVTDVYGTSTQTLTDFIEVVNTCGTSTPEPMPGNAASFSGAANNDYLNADNLNLNRNSFTFSCWLKPNGIQEDFSAIFGSQDGSEAFMLNFRDGNNTLGIHPTWWLSSGLQAVPNEWSHVALVSNGTDVKIYVNGVESIMNTALSSEVFTQINLGRYGRGRGDRYTNLEMDEVSIWNRPLTIDEIRSWRHLTKTNNTDPIFTGLVAYYQFNETAGNLSLNKASSNNTIYYNGTSGSNHTVSNVPVFEGVSQKININSAGTKNYNTAGLSITFENGTYPNGDVWVFQSSINPDVLPDGATDFDSYTIINNYGTNQTFTPLQSMTFTGNSAYVSSAPNLYNLYKRQSNDFNSTWDSKIDVADNVSGGPGAGTQITFSSGLNVDSFSQFVMSNESTLSSEDVINNNNMPSLYPNPISKEGVLNIDLPLDWTSSSMQVYNMLGQEVAHMSLKTGENKVILNIFSGVYTVLVSNQSKSFTSKVVKN